GDRFRYKGKMFDPQDRDNQVGSDRGKCKIKNLRGAVKCQGTTHLDGEIGGLGAIEGDIEYRGTATVRHYGFNVVGGSDDFEEATGDVGVRNLNEDGTKIMTKWDLVVP